MTNLGMHDTNIGFNQPKTVKPVRLGFQIIGSDYFDGFDIESKNGVAAAVPKGKSSQKKVQTMLDKFMVNQSNKKSKQDALIKKELELLQTKGSPNLKSHQSF